MKKKPHLYLNYVKICHTLETMYVNIVCPFSGASMVNAWRTTVRLESRVSMRLLLRVAVNYHHANLLLQNRFTISLSGALSIYFRELSVWQLPQSKLLGDRQGSLRLLLWNRD